MSSSRVTKAGAGAFALALAFSLSSCGNEGRKVFASVVDPVEVSVVAPQYVADLPHGADDSPGLLLRRGAVEREVPGGGIGSRWLNDGRAVVITPRSAVGCPGRQDDPGNCGPSSGAVLDLDNGRSSPIPGLTGQNRLSHVIDSSATSRVNLVVSRPTFDVPEDVIYSYAADLTDPVIVEEPPSFAEDAKYYYKGFGPIESIGAWDYRGFSVGDEESSAHRGYVMRKHGSETWTKVLVDQGIRELWVSRDGSALLAVQRLAKTDECEDCDRATQIVEIDPRDGTIVGEYGAPDDYTAKWRVVEVDKVEDRVLVQYALGGNFPENKGVWAFDGSWSLVPGTDGLFTWWQGADDRLEVEPVNDLPKGGLHYDLFWVHGGERSKLPGQLPNDFLQLPYPLAGSLAPPA